MKKIISLVILGFAVFSFFQLKAQGGFGIMGGINFNTLETPNLSSFKEPGVEAGPIFGVFYDFKLGKKWAIVPEVQYSSKGFTFLEGINESKVRTKTAYLDILPQVEYRPATFLGITGGVNIGIKLDEKIKGPDEKWKTALVELNKNRDFGFLIGIRFYLNRLNFKVHYNYGIRNNSFAEEAVIEGGELLKFKQFNRNLQFTVGYQIFY